MLNKDLITQDMDHGTEVGIRIGLSQSAVSRSVKRGEHIVIQQELTFEK